jgi:hypothetical protein
VIPFVPYAPASPIFTPQHTPTNGEFLWGRAKFVGATPVETHCPACQAQIVMPDTPAGPIFTPQHTPMWRPIAPRTKRRSSFPHVLSGNPCDKSVVFRNPNRRPATQSTVIHSPHPAYSCRPKDCPIVISHFRRLYRRDTDTC